MGASRGSISHFERFYGIRAKSGKAQHTAKSPKTDVCISTGPIPLSSLLSLTLLHHSQAVLLHSI